MKSTDTGDVLAVGAISNRSGKTITIGGYNDERRIFAWPSSRIMLCYDKPPIQYSLDDSVYALVQTERPMSEHEDIELRYSLENTLRADMQYNVSVLTGTNVCTFDTTYTVYNQSSDVSFDRISTLNIVDQTQRQQTVSRAMLRAPTAVSHYYAASSSSSPLEATTSQYEVEEAADSLVRPVYFSYTQPMSIGKTQTVELFNGEPAVVNCLLAYQTTELQPYMKASTPQVSTVLWFDTKTLVPLLTRSATTKVSITHADAKTTSASFSWNRDADATYIYSDKPWLAKYLSTMDSSRLSIENDGVEESTTEVTLKFHVSNFLPERAVIAFPVFPNQTDGRCSKVEYVPSKHADTSRRVVVETPEWASSALPQLYSVFSLEASERLNFLAHFSRRS